jgi:hypothetical protein
LETSAKTAENVDQGFHTLHLDISPLISSWQNCELHFNSFLSLTPFRSVYAECPTNLREDEWQHDQLGGSDVRKGRRRRKMLAIKVVKVLRMSGWRIWRGVDGGVWWSKYSFCSSNASCDVLFEPSFPYWESLETLSVREDDLCIRLSPIVIWNRQRWWIICTKTRSFSWNLCFHFF